MDGLASIFLVTVTSYHISEWISIEFGRLKESKLKLKNGSPFLIGEHRIFVKGNWSIVKDRKVIASRHHKNSETQSDQVKKSLLSMIGARIKKISVSNDLEKVQITFSNEYQLRATNSVPGTDWKFFIIE